jgi:hypothetical protein
MTLHNLCTTSLLNMRMHLHLYIEIEPICTRPGQKKSVHLTLGKIFFLVHLTLGQVFFLVHLTLGQVSSLVHLTLGKISFVCKIALLIPIFFLLKCVDLTIQVLRTWQI